MSNKKVTRTVVGAMVTIGTAALLASAVASAGQFHDRTYQAGSFPHSEDRQYTVYVPDSYDGATAVPLVVVVHGCNQTHRVAFDEQGWDKTADEYGFIVLAPFVTSYEGLRNPNCWGWWSAFDYEVHEGAGEIEDIYRIALEVESQYNIDPNQRHITGLSAGGFMANVAAVTHNEYWASAAVIEGGGYGETVSAYSPSCPFGAPRRTAGTWKTPQQLLSAMQAEFDDDYKIPMFLMHSTNDCTLGFGVEGGEWGGLTANRDAWLLHNGGNEHHSESCAGNGVSECTYTKFGLGEERSTVETLAYVGATDTSDGKGHYFAGGAANGNWTRTDGPDTRNIVWAFFAKHGRSPIVVDPEFNHPPSISLNGSAIVHVGLGGTFDDPGVTATDAEDGDLTDAITTSGSVDTGTAGTYTIRYSVTDSGETASGGASSANSATVTRTVVVDDAYCETFTSSTYGHVITGRASVCNGWYACAVGSGETLGFNNIFTTTTLYEAPRGHFSTTPCSVGVGVEGEDETVCWTDTNYRHAATGRAAYRFVLGLGYAYLATGSNDNLGYFGSASISLRRTAHDYYERVRTCP